MIEVVERLRELEGVLGDMRRFAARCRAFDGAIGFRSQQAATARNLPCCKCASRALRGKNCRENREALSPRLSNLRRMLRGAHGGVLHVGAGFAFEAEGFLEIESDHGIARELQHEVAQRADGDLRARPCCRSPGVLSGWRDVHFFQRRFDQLVDQVVGFDAQALAAGTSTYGRRLSSSESSMPSSTQVRGRQRHHFVGEVD